VLGAARTVRAGAGGLGGAGLPEGQKDYEGLAGSDAVVAVLDGAQVDDGTACEIGIFSQLMRTDPGKKGIVGLLTDLRSQRLGDVQEGKGVNLFVLGCIQAHGRVVGSIEAAIAVLREWGA